MARRPSPALANAVVSGVRVERIEPLQTRIAKNRWRFIGFMVAFTTGVALSVAITVGLSGALVALLVIFRAEPTLWTRVSEPTTFVLLLAGATFVATLGVVSAWSAARLLRSEITLLGKLEARMPPGGTFMPTKSALRDMAIAAGLPKTPQFYVIDTPRVNAFVLGRSVEQVRIGVTTGLVERIPIEEQRAVFATLIARVLTLDTLWSTAVSAVMGPIWAMRERSLRIDPRMVDEDDAIAPEFAAARSSRTATALLGSFVFQGLAVIFTELLAWYHREAAWTAAEKNDAEGMLLLRDPRSMLRAIEHVLECNNHVPQAGDAYSQLFFCWAGYGFAPEDDPEMRRVARLREALGAEGAAHPQRPNVPDWPSAPVAPRVGLLEEPGGVAS